MPARKVDLRTVLAVLFFCSGIPALLYQLMWERALFRIFGVNVESVTIVVTAFMIGLGLGSIAGGWLSSRRNLDLLAALAALEIGIAAFGVASLWLFERVGLATAAWSLPATSIAVLAVLLVPTLLMGASLPVLVGYLVRRAPSVGPSLGLLYYSNTLGAGAACLLGAAILFPFLGMQQVVAAAALMNSLVAAGALIVRTRPLESGAMPAPRDPATQEAAQPLLVPFGTALWLAFGGGFVALSYEILFFRVTSFLTGSNPAALPLVLGAFIIGLAGGAREAGRLCATPTPTGQAPIGQALKQVMYGLAVAVIAALIFLPLLRWIAPAHRLVALCTGLFLIYVSGRNWGLLFPYLVDRSVAAGLQAGQRLSFLYLANILGSATGAVLTGFVLTDWVGLRGLGLILGAIAAAVTLLAVRALAADRSAWRPLRAWAGAVAALLVLQLPLTEGLIGAIQFQKSPPLVEAVENRSGIVTVDELQRVYGNGMYDGQFNIGLDTGANNIERAYAIALYHPAPRRVLVIGMSSGSWSQVIANWDGVQSVTIVEINPGYAKLIAERSMVASLLRNPKVTLVIDDGRRWLRRNPQERFDAVIANTSIHFRANASNVLSLEFMDLVRRHLNPGGVLFYNTTGSMRSLRTGCVAFRHGVRIEAFAAVSDQPLEIDAERWIRALTRWRIDGKLVLDLNRDKDRKLLDGLRADVADLDNATKPPADRWIEDCPSILARSAGFVPITDDNMGTEWRTNLGMAP